MNTLHFDTSFIFTPTQSANLNHSVINLRLNYKQYYKLTTLSSKHKIVTVGTCDEPSKRLINTYSINQSLKQSEVFNEVTAHNSDQLQSQHKTHHCNTSMKISYKPVFLNSPIPTVAQPKFPTTTTCSTNHQFNSLTQLLQYLSPRLTQPQSHQCYTPFTEKCPLKYIWLMIESSFCATNTHECITTYSAYYYTYVHSPTKHHINQ